jgi:hypothetical protein
MTTQGRSYWAKLHVLDRQVLDVHGLPAAKVDDLELALPDEPDSLPVATEILCGPAALGRRFGGRLGAAVETMHQLLGPHEHARPASISMGVVTEIGPAVHLDVSMDDLEVSAVDDFLAEHIIAKIPGSQAGKSRREEAQQQ